MAQKTRTGKKTVGVPVQIRVPARIDEEVGLAAEKMGLKKATLYRNLVMVALEDYRLLDKLGLFRAAAYITGTKQRLRDQLEEEGYDELLEE